jgi:hypothetical protein
MDSQSAMKAAKNEAISRTLNEGLAKGEDRWPSVEPTFICECKDLSCTQEISVPLSVYRRVREHPAHFVLVPGHMDEEIERKVDDGPGFDIVEKIGPGKRVAEEMR